MKRKSPKTVQCKHALYIRDCFVEKRKDIISFKWSFGYILWEDTQINNWKGTRHFICLHRGILTFKPGRLIFFKISWKYLRVQFS